VIYVGLGGSGIAGDVLAGLGLPVQVWKGPGIPPTSTGATLLAVSYSGETRETLSSVHQAMERGMKVVVLTSGGKLLSVAKERGLPYIQVPGGLPPRLAFPYLLLPALRLFQDSNRWLRIEEFRVGALNFTQENFRKGKELASAINGKIPVIYGSKFSAVAKRMKQQINENAKYPAFYGEVPEIHHNEVEGYGRGFPLLPILVKDQVLDDVTANLLNPVIIEPPQGSILYQLGALIHLADVTSLFLAQLLNEDPYVLRVIPKARELTTRILS
jgi:glucose/mannose-6-phosphate isomerase